VKYTFDWPMYAMLGVSIVSLLLSFRLGGSMEDIKVNRGTSKGQAVH
jgi:hypothetical protein